jgi:hypothetical protein
LPVVADDDMPLTGSANAVTTEIETDTARVDIDMPISKAAPLSIDDQPLSGQSSHSNTSASKDATTSTAAAMTDAFASTDPAEQPPTAVTDSTTSNSDSSLLSDRLVSKDWKVRKPAFEELVQVFQTATSKIVFAEYGK